MRHIKIIKYLSKFELEHSSAFFYDIQNLSEYSDGTTESEIFEDIKTEGEQLFVELFSSDPKRYESKLKRIYEEIYPIVWDQNAPVEVSIRATSIYSRIAKLFDFHGIELPLILNKFSDWFKTEYKHIAPKIVEAFKGKLFVTVVRVLKTLLEEDYLIGLNNRKRILPIIKDEFDLPSGSLSRFSEIMNDDIPLDKHSKTLLNLLLSE